MKNNTKDFEIKTVCFLAFRCTKVLRSSFSSDIINLLMFDFNQLGLKSLFQLLLMVKFTLVILWKSVTVTKYETALTLDS